MANPQAPSAQRIPALHRGDFPATGRAFREPVIRLSVSELLAGGRFAAGRSPVAARSTACEAGERAPIPIPHRARRATRPS